ncbi:hypothetical protein JHK82_024322 [Glycine max]|nr:hypothetical protein JHK85_024905 [Glycine max]KAG5133134.1 hypothetical protein JHK82_024322 [Glycine max]
MPSRLITYSRQQISNTYRNQRLKQWPHQNVRSFDSLVICDALHRGRNSVEGVGEAPENPCRLSERFLDRSRPQGWPHSLRDLGAITRKKPPRKEIVVSNDEAILAALKETLRYGLFLETFAGTFVSTDEVIGSIVDHHRHTTKWRALVAGAVAGSSMLLIGLEDQHTSLAIYILMRATVLASRCGIKSK